MKFVALIAALLVAVAAPLRAEDAPKDPQPKPLAGWNKKFSLQSADGRFRLNLGGRLQAYYEEFVPDHDSNRVQFGPAFAAKPLSEDTSQFRIRRGRVAFDGNVYDPSLLYEVQIELAGSSTSLKRAYFNWHRSDALQFRAGRFKAPFGRQQLVSIFKQELTDRSIASNEFTKGDDDGVMLWGTPLHGRVEYYLGVFNGDGQNKNSQQDNRNQWFARAVWSPRGKFAYSESSQGAPATPQWSFGVNAGRNGGWLFDVNGKSGVQGPMQTCTATGCTVDHGDDATIGSAGVDAAMTWNRFSSVAEAFTRSIDARQAGVRTVKSRGWYAQSGWFVQRDKSEIGLRYSVLDLDRARFGDRSIERALFFNRYVRGHDYKVQTELTEVRSQAVNAAGGPASLRDRRLRVQLVLSF
ncbi:MAG TPA: porin [Thermoanaerobaculia bacterium]|nr:porin [Thermoanaerobaculia bacterium]